jgi:hypothetical protein
MPKLITSRVAKMIRRICRRCLDRAFRQPTLTVGGAVTHRQYSERRAPVLLLMMRLVITCIGLGAKPADLMRITSFLDRQYKGFDQVDEVLEDAALFQTAWAAWRLGSHLLPASNVVINETLELDDLYTRCVRNESCIFVGRARTDHTRAS